MKRIREKISFAMAVAVAVVTMAGCSGSNSSSVADSSDNTSTNVSEAAAEPTTIRVGIVTNTMGVPAAYALENGFYEEEGINVEPVIFSTGSLVNEAFGAGEIDVAFSGLASIFSLATGQASWIGEINTTDGLGIYVRPDSPILEHKGEVSGYENVYGSADTLRGITILGPLGNVAQYGAANWLAIFGLTDQDASIVNMDYGPAYQAFISGEGDAVSVNNPYSFMLEADGYVCAATFEDATKTQLYDGIFASTSFVENNRDAMVSFIRATYKAVDVLQDDAVRSAFSMEWFAENGKEYTQETMDEEISLRRYIDSAFMQQPDFVFGEGMVTIADFYVNDGKITEEGKELLPGQIDVTLLEDALGIDIATAGTEGT